MVNDELTQDIREYIKHKKQAKLEDFDKKVAKRLESASIDSKQYNDLAEQLQNERAELETNYVPATWLTNAAKRANQIRVVTHALKFTHTDAKGTSLYDHSVKSADPQAVKQYVCTQSLHKPAIDVVGNAAALDVAGLLCLEHKGKQLIDYIAQNDTSALAPLADNNEQIKLWLSGFRQVLENNQPASHTLAKQIYFPVSEGHDYHLLAPLFASSLTQRLYETIIHHRYSDQAKEARKARKDGKYHEQPVVNFSQLAIQTFGGTKPQNVSQLNSKRGGRAFLLNAQPPQWQRQTKPPASKKAFWRGYERSCWKTTKAFKNYLETNKNVDSNCYIRDKVRQFVDSLIEKLLNYAAIIQGLPSGWSQEHELPESMKLWLDPFREDKDLQTKRAHDNWRDEIASDFARWLNNKLNKNQSELVFAHAEFTEWHDLLKNQIL